MSGMCGGGKERRQIDWGSVYVQFSIVAEKLESGTMTTLFPVRNSL